MKHHNNQPNDSEKDRFEPGQFYRPMMKHDDSPPTTRAEAPQNKTNHER